MNDLNQKVKNLKTAIDDLSKVQGVISVGTNMDMNHCYVHVHKLSNIMQFDGPVYVTNRIDGYYKLIKNVEGIEVFCLEKELPEEYLQKEGVTHENIKAAD